MSKKAKRNNRKRNETPEENLARRTAKAEFYLHKVAKREGIDLSALDEEQYNEKLAEITAKLTALKILK